MYTGQGLTDYFYKNKGQDNYLDSIIKSVHKVQLGGMFSPYKNRTSQVDLRKLVPDLILQTETMTGVLSGCIEPGRNSMLLPGELMECWLLQ